MRRKNRKNREYPIEMQWLLFFKRPLTNIQSSRIVNMVSSEKEIIVIFILFYYVIEKT